MCSIYRARIPCYLQSERSEMPQEFQLDRHEWRAMEALGLCQGRWGGIQVFQVAKKREKKGRRERVSNTYRTHLHNFLYFKFSVALSRAFAALDSS
jgi:hypothetical protein